MPPLTLFYCLFLTRNNKKIAMFNLTNLDNFKRFVTNHFLLFKKKVSFIFKKKFLLSLKKSSKKGKNSAILRVNSYKLGFCSKPDIECQIRTIAQVRSFLPCTGEVPAVLSRAELPKSAILTCPVMSSNMFSGLISR